MKKLFTILTAILLIAATALPLVSCGGSSSSPTYKMLSRIGSQYMYSELHLASDNTFYINSRTPWSQDGFNITMVITYTGTYTADGDTATCTAKDVEYKYEFESEADKKSVLAKMDAGEIELSADGDEFNYAAINGGYKRTYAEEIELYKTSSYYPIYYPETFSVKLGKSNKTAILTSVQFIDCSRRETEKYEYFDDEPGVIKTVIRQKEDGTVYGTSNYTKDGVRVD